MESTPRLEDEQDAIWASVERLGELSLVTRVPGDAVWVHRWTAQALDNLALACQGCNNFKFIKTEAVDPLTRKHVALFHPRRERWSDHFSRPGDNRYANSTVALRGSTGEVAWHFQTVHHDVWDYDNGSQPVLADILDEEDRTIEIELVGRAETLDDEHEVAAA